MIEKQQWNKDEPLRKIKEIDKNIARLGQKI